MCARALRKSKGGKSEIRISKSETNSKDWKSENSSLPGWRGSIRFPTFHRFRICFGFRYSDFGFPILAFLFHPGASLHSASDFHPENCGHFLPLHLDRVAKFAQGVLPA
jgi:hypothetical protein